MVNFSRMSTRNHFWPVSNSNPEDAIFTLVVDSDQNLFTAGNIIKGYVYLCFTDTKEELTFKTLKLCLRRNVPELKDEKKHVNTQIVQEDILVHFGDKVFSNCIDELNDSKPSKIPFEIVLPNTLESSFNSTQITICYELKADLQELLLCGELCDISAVLPIEVIEIANDALEEAPTAQVQEFLEDHLVTFYASLKKQTYFFGESLVVDFYVDAPVCENIDMNFQIQQLFSLKGGKICLKTLEMFEGHFQPAKETGILLSKYAFLLDKTIYTTQPTVNKSVFVNVKYQVIVTASFKGTKLELKIPFVVERNDGMHKRYPKIYSEQGYPLLPLTVTVEELKSDGLQSYIPLKQCYENNRLTVKKGNVGGIKSILTILADSTAYTKHDVIKGFVYLSLSNITNQVVFDNLIIVLVGACQYKHTGTMHKNGEMFLFESQTLQGNKNGKQTGSIVLSPPTSGIVAEFEFDLSKIKKTLLPTFSSEDVLISYELKADLFNLSLNNQKASLHARLPIVVRDDNLTERFTIPKSIGQLCKKDFSISLNMDKLIYKHKDEISLKINLDNKSKKQTFIRICLIQFTECMQSHQILHERIVSKPILLLVLPKSKLVSEEKISLNDEVFHFQPTLLCCERISVTYSLIVDVPDSEPSMKNKSKLAIPVAITRKNGFEVKTLSCEGYPLLPLTLEYYCKDENEIPNFLIAYKDKSLVKVLNSSSCIERWKGWKLKT